MSEDAHSEWLPPQAPGADPPRRWESMPEAPEAPPQPPPRPRRRPSRRPPLVARDAGQQPRGRRPYGTPPGNGAAVGSLILGIAGLVAVLRGRLRAALRAQSPGSILAWVLGVQAAQLDRGETTSSAAWHRPASPSGSSGPSSASSRSSGGRSDRLQRRPPRPVPARVGQAAGEPVTENEPTDERPRPDAEPEAEPPTEAGRPRSPSQLPCLSAAAGRSRPAARACARPAAARGPAKPQRLPALRSPPTNSAPQAALPVPGAGRAAAATDRAGRGRDALAAPRQRRAPGAGTAGAPCASRSARELSRRARAGAGVQPVPRVPAAVLRARRAVEQHGDRGARARHRRVGHARLRRSRSSCPGSSLPCSILAWIFGPLGRRKVDEAGHDAGATPPPGRASGSASAGPSSAFSSLAAWIVGIAVSG